MAKVLRVLFCLQKEKKKKSNLAPNELCWMHLVQGDTTKTFKYKVKPQPYHMEQIQIFKILLSNSSFRYKLYHVILKGLPGVEGVGEKGSLH